MKRIIIILSAVLITHWSFGQTETDTTMNNKNEKEMNTINEDQKNFLQTLAYGLSKPPKTPILKTPKDYGLEYEEVSFTTEDGVTLKGWFIPGDSKNIIISNHFSPGNKYGFAGHLEGLDFAGGFEVNFLPRYKALHDAGYNVFAYDLRSHGESGDSESGVTGVGYFEWQDVLASIDYIRNRKETSDRPKASLICYGPGHKGA
jgi:dipeptidyl aminopeptidase/acylaminoacyl peptidase